MYSYLIYYGFEKTVIDSQVIVPALKLKEQGIPIRLILFESFPRWISLLSPILRSQYKKRMQGLPYVTIPRIPRNFFYLNTLILMVYLLRHGMGMDRWVLHARGLQGAYVVLALKRWFSRLKVICDVRGMEADEYEYSILKNKNRPLNTIELDWKTKLIDLTRQAICGADVSFYVSRAMKNELTERLQLHGRPTEYVPCALDVSIFSSGLKNREQMRKHLGVENRIVVVYSGAVRSWQMPGQLVDLFQLMREVDPRCFFLALTPDVGDIQRLLNEKYIPAKEVLIKHVDFTMIPNYLACGDLGLLIREENDLNRFACPTKYAEYLSCGLHVLQTKSIWDAAELSKEHRVGSILSDVTNRQVLKDDLKKILTDVQLSDGERRRRSQVARDHFDWSIYVPRIKKWYFQLASVEERNP